MNSRSFVACEAEPAYAALKIIWILLEQWLKNGPQRSLAIVFVEFYCLSDNQRTLKFTDGSAC